MTINKIEPALSPEEWKPIIADLAQHPFDEKGERHMGTSGYYESIGGDAAGCAWGIAVNNYALPDSDPRKITRGKIEALRDLANVVASALRQTAVDVNAERVREFADALESYLPPEG